MDLTLYENYYKFSHAPTKTIGIRIRLLQPDLPWSDKKPHQSNYRSGAARSVVA